MSRPRVGRIVVLAALAALAGCGQNAEPRRFLNNSGEGPGATVLTGPPMENPKSGQTIYLPVYAYIHINDDAKPFNLAITVSIRNTDTKQPIIVKSVDYHGSSGSLIRPYLEKPIRLDPLASTSFFVLESDSLGGSSTSFLVEWVAAEAAHPAAAEAVMVGTMMNHSVTLTSQGRVIAESPGR